MRVDRRRRPLLVTLGDRLVRQIRRVGPDARARTGPPAWPTASAAPTTRIVRAVVGGSCRSSGHARTNSSGSEHEAAVHVHPDEHDAGRNQRAPGWYDDRRRSKASPRRARTPIGCGRIARFCRATQKPATLRSAAVRVDAPRPTTREEHEQGCRRRQRGVEQRMAVQPPSAVNTMARSTWAPHCWFNHCGRHGEREHVDAEQRVRSQHDVAGTDLIRKIDGRHLADERGDQRRGDHDHDPHVRSCRKPRAAPTEFPAPRPCVATPTAPTSCASAAERRAPERIGIERSSFR